jgi:hypothetical protein
MDLGRERSCGAAFLVRETLVDVTNAYKVFDPPTVELFDSASARQLYR